MKEYIYNQHLKGLAKQLCSISIMESDLNTFFSRNFKRKMCYSCLWVDMWHNR